MPSTRAGRYERQPEGYRAFVPAPFPPRDLQLDSELQAMTSGADLALGRLDGVVNVIPDPELFVLMYVRKRRCLSADRGDAGVAMDVLEFEADSRLPAVPSHVEEIVNHVAALNHGLRAASRDSRYRVGLDLRDPRGAPPNVRGATHKLPVSSAARRTGSAALPATARFVPPPPHLVDDTMPISSGS